MTGVGLPHSGTPGSQPARGSPGRIVVRHALRRLAAPRHPPIALGSLIAHNLWFSSAAASQARLPAPAPRQPKRPWYYLLGFPFFLSAVFKVPVETIPPPDLPRGLNPGANPAKSACADWDRLSGATAHRWSGWLLKDENP